jgi:hypothetical protein
MPACEPFEAFTFTLQVNSRLTGVPLDVTVTNVEGQSAQFVSPFKDDRTTGSEVRDDSWYGFVAKRVQVCMV